MAINFAAFLAEAGLLALLALLASVVIFPLALLLSFLYSFLAKKYDKVPRFALLIACLFAGALAVLAITEIYLGSMLQQILSTPYA
jgi:4-hydroxybenzoate polyprenyltransferase